jgi:hypothetical protein
MTGGVSHRPAADGSTAPTYDVVMAGNFKILRRHTRTFFTNWAASDEPIPARLRLTVRNRARAVRKGCCGHPGQPGC